MKQQIFQKVMKIDEPEISKTEYQIEYQTKQIGTEL